MALFNELDPMFHPRSVAIVGVSRQARHWGDGNMFMRALENARFAGTIYPVNPHVGELDGRRCYPSLRAIRGPVDYVISSIPSSSIPNLVDDCVLKGVRALHIFSAGFRETGDSRLAELEREILARARGGDLRIIGPNCMGLYVPGSGLSFGNGYSLEEGRVAFISQSGLNAEDLAQSAPHRGVHFSKIVSMGNAVDLDESDFLEYCGEDPSTAIIAAYVEGTKDGQRFQRVLESASAAKPVTILKGGVTGAGRRAVTAHTGSESGCARAWSELVQRANAISVQTLEELEDMMVTGLYLGPLRGPSVAIIGVGGGASVLAADAAVRAGLRVPTIPRGLQTELRELIPVAGSSVLNPLDTNALDDPELFARVASALSKAAGIDVLVVVLRIDWALGRLKAGVRAYLEQVIRTCAESQLVGRRPLAIALTSPTRPAVLEAMQGFEVMAASAGLAVFPSVQRAVRAIGRAWRWHRERAARGLPRWTMGT